MTIPNGRPAGDEVDTRVGSQEEEDASINTSSLDWLMC